MVSQVDSTFGIRTTRVIQLLFNEPVMQIRTTFDRVATPARTLINSNIAVWIDCQASVSTSSKVYIPVPSPSIFAPTNYTLSGDAYVGFNGMPPSFNQANGLISFGPDSSKSHKLGFDSGTLVLVGTNISLRMDAPRIPNATYTSGFNSAVYTAQYSASSPFFELELLSPAPTLSVGQSITFITTYSLFHRTGATTDAEAQKVPGLAILIKNHRDIVILPQETRRSRIDSVILSFHRQLNSQKLPRIAKRWALAWAIWIDARSN